MDEKIFEKLKAWDEEGKADPEKVQIYPTNKCNLKCIFCAQRLKEYGYDSEVSKDRWLEITREICEMNVNRILISGGGEPFCRPETTLEIMKLVKDNGIEGRLITSGSILNKEICENIVDMKWDSLVFSIDGARAKTHDFLRGREGTLGKVLENIRRLKQIRGGGKFPGLEINFVLNRINYKEIPEMVLFVEEMDFRSINFEPVTVNNPKDKKLKLNRRERERLREKIIPRAKRLIESEGLQISTNLDTLKNIKAEKAGKMKEEIKTKSNIHGSSSLENNPCYEPWLWPKIEPNGDVWPCSTAPLHENIKEKSFEEIWFGEEFTKFRENIKSGNLPEHCQNCVTSHVEINKEIRAELESNL